VANLLGTILVKFYQNGSGFVEDMFLVHSVQSYELQKWSTDTKNTDCSQFK